MLTTVKKLLITPTASCHLIFCNVEVGKTPENSVRFPAGNSAEFGIPAEREIFTNQT